MAVVLGALAGRGIGDTAALGLDAAFPAVLLALVLPSLTEGHGFAGWARPAGVLVAGILTLRKAPFPLIVVLAAATTAVLRLLGVP
ncbi:AzlD domain-containing protein [Microbispora bryophytorum]|uniref:AzlD domain-containing protein n=1 Tax=Microbispora bryophytorum TaxID=1460882 RepID=UPI0033E52745